VTDRVPGKAVCPNPLSSRRVVELTTSAPLPPTNATAKLDLALPLEVQLTNGALCYPTPFMPDTFQGHIVGYLCPAGLRLLDYPNRSRPLWRFHTARVVSVRPTHYRGGATVRVRAAWYAQA
jgi:hypothetical protein